MRQVRVPGQSRREAQELREVTDLGAVFALVISKREEGACLGYGDPAGKSYKQALLH